MTRRPNQLPPDTYKLNVTASDESAPNELIKIALAARSRSERLFLVWYLGTKYRLGVLHPLQERSDALRRAAAGARGGAYPRSSWINVLVSVRRILGGFFVAIAARRSAWPAHRQVQARERIAHDARRSRCCARFRLSPGCRWRSCCGRTTKSSIVFITFIGAFFPILLNTIHGVHTLDGVLIRAGRCLGANELRLFWHVILPGALAARLHRPFAVGMGVAWVSLIAAEMISGQFGVGYFTRGRPTPS